jgi:hypothetical protein
MIQEFPNEADNVAMEKWIFNDMQQNLELLLKNSKIVQPALAHWLVPQKTKLALLKNIVTKAAGATFITITTAQVKYWVSECATKAVELSTSAEALALAMSFAFKLHTNAPHVDHQYILQCLEEVDIRTKDGVNKLVDKIGSKAREDMVAKLLEDKTYQADKINDLAKKFLINDENRSKFSEILCA